MAEKLGLDQLARDRRHVHRHEGPLAAAAVVVERAGHQLLAGAGLAHDHHREVGLGQPRDDAVDLLHCRGAPDDGQRLGRDVGIGRNGLLGLLKRPANSLHQGIEIKWFWQVVVSPALSRGDGRHDGVLGAHHDHRQRRPELLDARDHVEGVLVGQHNVGDDGIALAFRHPAPEGGGGGGRAHAIAGPAEGLAQNRANGAVVIRDQTVLLLMPGCLLQNPAAAPCLATSAAARGRWFPVRARCIRRSRHGRARSWRRAPARGPGRPAWW